MSAAPLPTITGIDAIAVSVHNAAWHGCGGATDVCFRSRHGVINHKLCHDIR